MRRIVVASRNRHKLIELADLLAGIPVALEALPDLAPEVIEDGLTFAANARKKAEAAADFTAAWALADDSGLEVDALDGAPGVLSAQFAGVTGPGADAANNQQLLTRLSNVADAERTARFRCVIALARPGHETLCFAGTVAGRITREPRGEYGFGYDPLFDYPPFAATFAEVDAARKNRVSHRAAAMRALRGPLLDLVS